MMLQPLVENSIKHGMARKIGPGLVTHPKRRAHAGRAIIEVEDDGMGFMLDRLDEPMSSGIEFRPTFANTSPWSTARPIN